MNKRGLAPKFIMGLLLALVLMLIIVSFTGSEGRTAVMTVEEKDCWASIMMNAEVEGAECGQPEGNINVITDEKRGIRCPTRVVSITGEEEDAIKKELARTMYSCWARFGSFTLNPFPNSGSKNICMVCANITFRKDVDNIDLQLTKEETTDKHNFYELFTNKQLSNYVDNELLSTADKYEYEKGYATVFVITDASSIEGYFNSVGTQLNSRAFKNGLVYLIPGETADAPKLKSSGIGFGSGIFRKKDETYNQAVFLLPMEYVSSLGCHVLPKDDWNPP